MSLDINYVFAIVMSLDFPMCILISCSSVLCVLMALGMFMFVNVISSLISGMRPHHLFVLSVCAYGGVAGYFFWFSFLCEFYLLYCNYVRLDAVYEFFFRSWIWFLMLLLLI